MDNEFQQRRKMDAELDVQTKVTVSLDLLRSLVEEVGEMRQTLKLIREEMRNIDKLRPLKK